MVLYCTVLYINWHSLPSGYTCQSLLSCILLNSPPSRTTSSSWPLVWRHPDAIDAYRALAQRKAKPTQDCWCRPSPAVFAIAPQDPETDKNCPIALSLSRFPSPGLILFPILGLLFVLLDLNRDSSQ